MFRSLACAVLVSACSHSDHSTDRTVSAPVAGEGKPMAPVAVETVISKGSVRVAATFEADAESVSIELHGVDGLTVANSGVRSLATTSFKRGQTTVVEAPVTGTGVLAVTITGTFNGARSRRVVSVDLRAGTAADGVGTTSTDQGPLKLLPSGD
jgi:hypothetical protein